MIFEAKMKTGILYRWGSVTLTCTNRRWANFLLAQSSVYFCQTKCIRVAVSDLDGPLGLQEVKSWEFLDSRHLKVLGLSVWRTSYVYRPGDIPENIPLPHTVQLCVLCSSQDKQLLYSFAALTDFFFILVLVYLLCGTNWIFKCNLGKLSPSILNCRGCFVSKFRIASMSLIFM